MGLTREPMAAPLDLFKELVLEGEIGVLRQNSNKRIMSLTPITVLSLRVGSFSNRSFIIFKAGSIGTDVKGLTHYKS